LVSDDHNFKNYEIIYLVITGEANSICLNKYYYSLQEVAEIFEGRLEGKILHFSNAKILDLDEEEAADPQTAPAKTQILQIHAPAGMPAEAWRLYARLHNHS